MTDIYDYDPLNPDPNGIDPYGYYDANADPYGVAQFMTPQVPGQISTAKWNYGQQQPYSVDTMSKQGNALQDYYQILSNPVTQWLNMVSTGSQSLDLNSLLGGGGMSPRVASLLSSSDDYLRTVGEQLQAGAAPETIKLQMRQVPEIADDEDRLAILDAAADQGFNEMTKQKAEGPLATFEKFGLTNPLQTYTEADLPGDVAADKGMVNRWFGGAGEDEPMQWSEYGDWYRNAAEALRRQNDELQAQVPKTPEDPWSPTGSLGKLTKSDPEYYTKGVELQKRVLGPGKTGGNPGGPGSVGSGGGGSSSGSYNPASVAIQNNLAKIKDYEARVKEADKYNKGPKRATVDQIVSGVNRIRAKELAAQGRTPARDQARSMMQWLAAQNYGG